MIRRIYILTLLSLLTYPMTYAEVPPTSQIILGIDEETMRQHLDEIDLQPLEGIWYYPKEQTKLAIERWKGEKNIAYRIILIESPDLQLLPGTVVGYLAPSAVDNKFEMWLYSEHDHVNMTSPLNCVATLNANATSLTFDPPHWKLKVRVNLARFLPSFFRGISITPDIEREKLPIGFTKVYPRNGNGNAFDKIRYL